MRLFIRHPTQHIYNMYHWCAITSSSRESLHHAFEEINSSQCTFVYLGQSWHQSSCKDDW